MTDLEKLLRDRQDELRGRPEDWIDRLAEWESRQDWTNNFMMLSSAALIFASLLALAMLITSF